LPIWDKIPPVNGRAEIVGDSTDIPAVTADDISSERRREEP